MLIRLIRLIGRVFQNVFWSNTRALLAEFVKSDTRVQCFLDFLLDLQAKTLTFDGFFGRLPARTALESNIER